MTRYRATFTYRDGRCSVLHLIARTAWDAYESLFDAIADDDVISVRMRRSG